MAYLALTRTAAYEFNGAGDVGADGTVRVNGWQHGRFTFSLQALRAALGDRYIKVTQLQFEWRTSAKFNFNCYFNTSSSADGVYAGEDKGSSTTYMAWAGFATQNATLCNMLQTKINTTNDNDVYFTLHKQGDPKGTGNCDRGSITVYYELGAPKQTDIINNITTSSEVALNGGSVSYTISAYNTRSSKVTSAKVELFCVSGDTNVKVADDATYSVNIASYASKSFSGTANIYNNLNLPRGSQIRLKLTITGTGVSANQTTDFVKLIDKYYAPSIKAFSLWRCSDVSGTMQRDDSGTKIMTDMQIGLDAASAGSFTLKAYYQENGSADTSVSPHIDLNLATNFSTLIAGVTDNTTLFEDYIFSNASAWFFKLVLSDGIETATADLSVSKSFANMHLAGLPTGGVAFGMFSTSTGGANPEPKLESAYKIYPYGGISGCDYSTSEVKTPFKWINGKPIYRKVITHSTAISGGQTVSLNHGIDGATFGTLISLHGMGVQEDSETHFELKPLNWGWPGTMDATGICLLADKDGTTLNINVATGSAFSTYNLTSLHVVIEYTKTTD